MTAFSGLLVSPDYLGRTPPPAPLAAGSVARFVALRRQASAVLGPALAPRAVATLVALPLARWLGWPPPSVETASADCCTCALVAARTEPVLLVVTASGMAGRPVRHAIGRALEHAGRWLIVTDGRMVRLSDVVRGEPRGVLDIDLDACAADPGAMAWLVSLAGPRAFEADAPRSLAAVAGESDAHGRRVCAALRDGVDAALETMTAAVATAVGCAPDRETCYLEARTAVYRVLFLLFAEARHLVPMWHATYRRGYTIEALGTRAASGASPRGTWAGLQAIARLAHAGAEAGDLKVVAFNGRLFSPARAPLLDHLTLDDARVARSLTALCYATSRGGGLQRIAYADLGVEELGSVYESLIDREPRRDGAHGPAIHSSGAVASARKTTGTFYTPRALADAIVRETLAPLVAGKTPDEILALRVLDPAMGSGAFLVSASRFLAARWEAAMIETGQVSATDLAEADRADVRRRIASRCLFGVDRNPMAVQLAQLSVWLATLAERPLSFLDHHLVPGNSLIGASPLDVMARAPGRAASTRTLPLESLFDWSAALVSVRERRAALESTPDDTAAAVHEKERSLRAIGAEPGLAAWKHACDLWCAAWTCGAPSSGTYHALFDRALGRTSDRPAGLEKTAATLREAARTCGFFHWPLEFPEVFLDANGQPRADGGFDAVIGNPPWEMMRRDARRDAAARDEGTATVRFARDSGIYRSQGRGHANQVQLFVERALQLTRPGGRIGLLVPATILTDEGSGPLRRALVLANGLDAIDVYENRRAIFPIHRSVRFATLAATRYGRTTAVRCRFGLADPPSGHPQADGTSVVRLTPALLERLSGPDLAIPDLPTPLDAALVERLTHVHPALASRTGWHVTFGRELNATDDRDCFRDVVAGGWPVIEGRHLTPFRVDTGPAPRVADPALASARLGDRMLPLGPRLAYRDVASATNRTTLIAAIVPAKTVTVHTVFCLRQSLPIAEQRVLCALLNSFVANYLVRRRVTTHVTTAIVSTLPVPVVLPPTPLFAELERAARALEGSWDDHVSAGLQGAAAEAYGLSASELDHILATFPLIPVAERDAAAAAFSARMQQGSCR